MEPFNSSSKTSLQKPRGPRRRAEQRRGELIWERTLFCNSQRVPVVTTLTSCFRDHWKQDHMENDILFWISISFLLPWSLEKCQLYVCLGGCFYALALWLWGLNLDSVIELEDRSLALRKKHFWENSMGNWGLLKVICNWSKNALLWFWP